MELKSGQGTYEIRSNILGKLQHLNVTMTEETAVVRPVSADLTVFLTASGTLCAVLPLMEVSLLATYL